MQSLREDGIDIDDYLNISDSKELKSRERNLQSYMDIFQRLSGNCLQSQRLLSYTQITTFGKYIRTISRHCLIAAE